MTESLDGLRSVPESLCPSPLLPPLWFFPSFPGLGWIRSFVRVLCSVFCMSCAREERQGSKKTDGQTDNRDDRRIAEIMSVRGHLVRISLAGSLFFLVWSFAIFVAHFLGVGVEELTSRQVLEGCAGVAAHSVLILLALLVCVKASDGFNQRYRGCFATWSRSEQDTEWGHVHLH